MISFVILVIAIAALFIFILTLGRFVEELYKSHMELLKKHHELRGEFTMMMINDSLLNTMYPSTSYTMDDTDLKTTVEVNLDTDG